MTTTISSESATTTKAASPWLRVREAAMLAQVGVRLIYREVRAGRLRAAHLGGRRELRLRAEWIDDWLDAQTTGGGRAPALDRPSPLESLEHELRKLGSAPGLFQPPDDVLQEPPLHPPVLRGVRRRSGVR